MPLMSVSNAADVRVKKETFYVYHRGARLDYRYEIYRERDHALCIKAETTQLFIDAQGELMIDKPEYFARWQQKYLMP